MDNFLEGKKTWIGLIVAFAGALGIGDIIGVDNIEGIINTLIALIGFVYAAYGNWKAHQKIKAFKVVNEVQKDVIAEQKEML